MSQPPLPSLPDFVRAYDATEEGTFRRLLDHYERAPGTFTYQPSRQVSAPAFSHGVILHQIQAAVLTRGSPSGRKQNLEVVDLLWEAGEGRTVSCYPLGHGRFSIRRDLSIRVPVDFQFVESRSPNIFWFQPRRAYSLTELGLGVIGSILRMTFLVDEMANAGVEILDLSALHGTRKNVRYRLADLPTLSDAEVTAVMQQVARAYDAICAMERDWRAEAKARRDRRPPPPMESGLFG